MRLSANTSRSNMSTPLLFAVLLVTSLWLIWYFSAPRNFSTTNSDENEEYRQYYANELDNGTGPTNVVHSIIGRKCRQNTGVLIQQMRNTQQQMNRLFRRFVNSPKTRYEVFADYFEPTMAGFRYVLKPIKYYSADEYKYFLPLSDPSAPCNHITFGVGRSWHGEQALQRKYPQCRLLGVDPDEKAKAIVESTPNSRFIKGAIAEEDKNYQTRVKTQKGYETKTFHNSAMTTFLMNVNRGRVVDFMTIDVEGAEFGLLRVLHNKRAELPVICQWNVEIHYSNQKYGIKWEEVDETIGDILDEGHFVMLHVDSRMFYYKRAFFLNVADEECIYKFLC